MPALPIPRRRSAKSACATACRASRRSLPTEHKIEWIRDAYDAGQREIEVGSFVPAHLLPQLADTAELWPSRRRCPASFVSVLVPNLKGAERAIDAEADLMLVPLSASHAHSLANLRKTPDEVVAEVGRIRAARDAAGSKTLIEGGIGTAFGCTIQGRGRAERSAALHAGAARRRRRPREHRRHRRLRRPGAGARPVRAGARRSPATASGAATSTTRAASRWPTSTPRSRPASPASTPRSPASAAARTRPARAATLERRPRLHAREHGHRDRHRHRAAARAARQGRRLARRRDAARHAVARRPAQDFRASPHAAAA